MGLSEEWKKVESLKQWENGSQRKEGGEIPGKMDDCVYKDLNKYGLHLKDVEDRGISKNHDQRRIIKRIGEFLVYV